MTKEKKLTFQEQTAKDAEDRLEELTARNSLLNRDRQTANKFLQDSQIELIQNSGQMEANMVILKKADPKSKFLPKEPKKKDLKVKSASHPIGKVADEKIEITEPIIREEKKKVDKKEK